MQQHNVQWVCNKRKKHFTIPRGGCVVSTSRSPQPCFLFLLLLFSVYTAKEQFVTTLGTMTWISLHGFARRLRKRARVVLCVWYVCGNEIPDLKKKTPLAPPFFFYEWDIIQKLYITTVVNMHTPTYIRTYIHTHALDNSFLFWRRAQLTFSPRLVICTHGKSLPYLLISHGSLSLHLYIALFSPSFFTFSVRLSSFFFLSPVPTF